MIYIVDIDETICNTPLIDGKARYDLSFPIIERINKINNLFRQGHTIIYWTARGSSSGINQYQITRQSLEDWGALYTELRLGKPTYDIWIDDKAINDKSFFS